MRHHLLRQQPPQRFGLVRVSWRSPPGIANTWACASNMKRPRTTHSSPDCSPADALSSSRIPRGIDLIPVAAGMAALPESSEHTLIKARVDHLKAAGRIGQIEAAVGVDRAEPLKEDPEAALWLCPVDDRRAQG